MAITAKGLASAVVSKVRSLYSGGSDSWPVTPFDYVDAIGEYLSSNLEATFAYTGMTSTTPPAPEGGVVSAKLQCPLLTSGSAPTIKEFVKNIKVANPSAFVAAIVTDAIGTLVLQDGYTGAAPTSYIIKSVDSSIAKKETMEDCWELIASAVVDSILSLNMTKPTAASVKSPTGAGIAILTLVR